MAEVIQYGSLFNSYLIRGEKGSILVDTGPVRMRDRLYNQVKDQRLRMIILTHGHFDHLANAAYLARELQVPIAMHKADYVLVHDQEARPLLAENLQGKMMRWSSSRMTKSTPLEPFEPEIYLTEGMTLNHKEFGLSAVIRELPGHTQGSVGVLVDEEIFIVGDAMMNLLGSSETKLYENREQMLKSVALIRQCPASKIYVGHGPPIIMKR